MRLPTTQHNIPEFDVDEKLLTAHEPAAVERLNPDSKSDIVIVCDHASNVIPNSLNGLGVDPDVLGLHVAYDIGAAWLTKRLSAMFNASAFLSGYSRLVMDMNRFPDDISSIPGTSDRIVVPRNTNLSEEEKLVRKRELFDPYHAAIEAHINRICQDGRKPVVLSIHSFTPAINNIARPWHIGVLWNKDDTLSAPLLKNLTKHKHLCIGNNQPYHAVDPHGYTMATHAEAHGHAHLLLEIRQDLIDHEDKITSWATLLFKEVNTVIGEYRHSG